MFTKTVCNISKCGKLSAASRTLHFNCHPFNQASYVEFMITRGLHDFISPVFYASNVRVHITLHIHVDARLHMKRIHAYRAVILHWELVLWMCNGNDIVYTKLKDNLYNYMRVLLLTLGVNHYLSGLYLCGLILVASLWAKLDASLWVKLRCIFISYT